MESARSHVNRLREIVRRTILHPLIEGPRVERRNDRQRNGPGLRMAPNETGSTRAEHPFVSPSNQKITAEFAETKVFDTQRVNSIHTEDHPVLLSSRAIDGLNSQSHLVNRQLESCAGMNPGDGHDARCGGNTFL